MNQKIIKVAIGSAFAILSMTVGARAENPCNNPRSPRVGIVLVTPPKDQSAYLLRQSQIEKKIGDALASQFSSVACVVTDTSIFSDPANYPLLKGSLVFTVIVRPSSHDPTIAAAVVDINVAEGAFVENNFHMGAVPILIERDTNYDEEAKLIFQLEAELAANLSHSGKR